MLRKLFILLLLAALVVLPALTQDSGLTAKEIEEIGRTGAVSVGGGIGPQSVLAAQAVMTPNETLVMNWIDASVRPNTVVSAAQDMLAPDFVFYGTTDGPAWGADNFVRLDRIVVPTPENVFLSECVVKSEHDLVEARYSMDITFSGQVVSLSRTLLFRIEDGKIAEAWLDHTL
jgi:hypothetical protein